MRHGVVAVRVVAVVGRQQRRPDTACDLDQLRVRPVLVGQPVVLELDEEVALPEDVLQPGRPPLRLVLVARQQRLQHDTAQAAGRGDQPVVVSFEELPVDARLVVVALEVRGRGQLHEVAVALDVLRQQGQVVVELLSALRVATRVVDPAAPHRTLEARLARHVRLGADDRHDAAVAARLVEVEDPVHVPVVRDTERGLAVRHRGVDELAHPGGPVEHGELRVGVQMRKRPLRHGPSFRHGPRNLHPCKSPGGSPKSTAPVRPGGRPNRPPCRATSGASGPRAGRACRGPRPDRGGRRAG